MDRAQEPMTALSSDPDTYRVGGDVVPPRVIHRVNPDLSAFRDLRLRGAPTVEAIIDEEGKVTKARMLRDVDPKLDAALLAAVAQWRFAPATLHGKPVKVYFVLSMTIDVR